MNPTTLKLDNPNNPNLQVQSICNKCIPNIRYKIQNEVNLKYAPRIHFRFDKHVPAIAKVGYQGYQGYSSYQGY